MGTWTLRPRTTVAVAVALCWFSEPWSTVLEDLDAAGVVGDPYLRGGPVVRDPDRFVVDADGLGHGHVRGVHLADGVGLVVDEVQRETIGRDVHRAGRIARPNADRLAGVEIEACHDALAVEGGIQVAILGIEDRCRGERPTSSRAVTVSFSRSSTAMSVEPITAM